MRKEAIPFGERKLGVDRAENGNEMILKGPNGTFGSVHTMFLRGDTLELDLVLGKRILKVLRAFVVENV